ncbi:MAG: hypothetical protein ACK5NC_07805 [Vibrio sp.]
MDLATEFLNAKNTQIRRKIAWLVVGDYALFLGYGLLHLHSSAYLSFLMALFIFGYNYVFVRSIVDLPKGLLTLDHDKHLLLPVIVAVGLACFLLVLQIMRLF